MTNMINKIKTGAGIVLSALLLTNTLSSCESRLEEKPYNFYGEDYYSSTHRLNMGLRGVYEVFSELNTYGQYWMVYDTDTDIAHVNGANLGHVARDLGHYNAYANHPWLEQSWGAYYSGINRANLLLENAHKVKVEADAKDTVLYHNYIAETKAMRALAYFDLVRLFGDIPLKTEHSEATSNFKLPRTNAEEIYDFIIDELNEAIPNLFNYDEYPGGFVGRMSKTAAQAMLARVYLFKAGYKLTVDGKMERPANYKEYYQKVVEMADAVINSGKHELNPSYEQIFRNMCELKFEPKENMFEIQFFNPVGANRHVSNQGTYNGPSIHQNSQYGRANSFIKTLGTFAAIFEKDDLRKEVAIADWQINKDDQVKKINAKKSFQWAPGKWRRNWQTAEIKDMNNTDVNVVVMRYADVLLMKAEALNEVNDGPTAEAIKLVNQVRHRAFGKEIDGTMKRDLKVGDFDHDSFLNEIINERARELCFEGGRRMDLIRWNKLGEKLQETKEELAKLTSEGHLEKFNYMAGDNFVAGKHELYPIPNYEIRETGAGWKQNNGYTE